MSTPHLLGKTIVRHSLLNASSLLRSRKLSPVELVQDCLAKIEKLNPALNAFITVTADAAVAQARAAEAEIQREDWRGPLHGIPLGLKDIIDTAGIRTTAASAVFNNRLPQQDAEVVRRLRNAGAIFLGKQNLHEFAYGGSSLVSYFGKIRNPWNLEHIAGGSSGGSAAAVAAGLGLGAVGTDTAGSIREPASLCGVVGLKPTYGRVSLRGVIPLASSLDHAGPIATTVGDVAAILQVIAGYDANDVYGVDRPTEDYVTLSEAAAKSMRIGIPHRFFYEDLDPEVASAMDQAIEVLRTLSAEVREVDLEVPTDRTLQAAESYAYHAEFVARSADLYQAETLRRIRSGENITAEEFEKRRQELIQLRRDVHQVFDHIDLLATPTTPIPPPAAAELTENPDRLRPRELLLLRNTRPFNVWGGPAISVPCGFTRAGLPIGLQIAGPLWAEASVLQLAKAYEQATAWHAREPQLCLTSQ